MPIYEVLDAAGVDITAGRSGRYVVRDSDLPMGLDVLFEPKDNSEILIVSFQGALGRDQEPPRFERHRSLGGRTEHILFVSDTSIAPERNVHLAWYFGSEEFNLQEYVAEFISDLARRLNVSRVYLCGSSGGGFAALMIGQLISGSTAIAFDPQIRPILWGQQSFPQMIWPGCKYWRDFEKIFPTRLSFIELLASRDPVIESFQIIQNSGDEHHMTLHLPLIEAFLVAARKLDRDCADRCNIDVMYYGEGHVAPPVEVFNAWLDRVVQAG